MGEQDEPITRTKGILAGLTRAGSVYHYTP